MKASAISTQWKKSYLSILYNGPKSEADWPAAAELIQAGYADGRAMPCSDGSKPYLAVIWRGLTVQGRLFCDELEGAIERATWRYKLKIGFISFLSWCAGVVSGAVSETLKNLF